MYRNFHLGCVKSTLFTRRSEQTDKLPVGGVIQDIADQVPDVQVVRLADVADRVKRAGILDPGVGDSIFINERCLGRSDQLIVLGGDDGDLVAGLSNGLAVIETLDGSAVRTHVVASRATDEVEDLANCSARGVTEEVGNVIDVRKGSGMGGRSDGGDLVDEV